MNNNLLLFVLSAYFFYVFQFNISLSAQESGNLAEHKIIHQGKDRTYFLYTPKEDNQDKTKPAVFVLHGGGGASAQILAKHTGINNIADKEGFLVVFPYGIDGQWNDGRGKTFRRAKDNTDIDDVGFISAVIDQIIESGKADPKRIYISGMSNGGMMAYRLGIELGNRIAAIAAIIANLPANLAEKKPVRTMPILIMNGTEDPMMPWGGGSVRVLVKEYGKVLSADETLKYWLKNAEIISPPQITKIEDKNKDDNSTVELQIYKHPEKSLEIRLYKVNGGGHNLPGCPTPNRPLLLGNKNMDINAMEEIWQFFKKFELPD